MAELTVALIGCGGVGSIHLACWENLSGVRVAAVCDLNGQAAAEAARRFPGCAAFTAVADLLAGGPFDIVDVCTTPDAQFAAAQAALQAGGNVLCETPLTGNIAAAQTLVQLAAQRERLLMTGFCHRFHPPLLFAKDLLDNDELGRITMFRCRFSGLRPDLADLAAYPENVTTGALLESAIHGIDLFRYFCGEAFAISGGLVTLTPGLPVEDSVALVLQGEGALGVVEAGWSSPGGRNVVEIYGTAGACLVDYDTGALRYLTADQPVWRVHDEGGPNRFEREIAHFADAVRGLQPLVVTGEDGARAVELCAQLAQTNRNR